ncbi:hypothetical protein OK348_06815 [Flavobacterium sp. MXW15]|uniref:Uncharacterized protein n=1 Tax=Xanthomonas chitinilytica TaxID=2989819 RepID=A0ABT3JTC5_9XANT|nr:hypothetical protein [Xanthomonas sp. H13-6]MCW4454504.1 hypothetical protein [Flavobacterium sp. MXW15]MCW4471743.1 hypothetical protein [Xanthomonas sp. H13-6]
MDKRQADAIARAILEPGIRAQEEVYRKRMAEALFLVRRRQVGRLALIGCAIGGVVAYFIEVRLTQGLIGGGATGAVLGGLFIWLRARSHAARQRDQTGAAWQRDLIQALGIGGRRGRTMESDYDNPHGCNNVPPDVIFEYRDGYALPVRAMRISGEPYSGKASGSISVVDWDGAFCDGVPHGDFMWTYGGIQTRKARFIHGEIAPDSYG